MFIHVLMILSVSRIMVVLSNEFTNRRFTFEELLQTDSVPSIFNFLLKTSYFDIPETSFQRIPETSFQRTTSIKVKGSMSGFIYGRPIDKETEYDLRRTLQTITTRGKRDCIVGDVSALKVVCLRSRPLQPHIQNLCSKCAECNQC